MKTTIKIRNISLAVPYELKKMEKKSVKMRFISLF